MSKRNRPLGKAQRREERASHQARVSTTLKHGICADCGRRRTLFLPAGLCDKCCRYYSGE